MQIGNFELAEGALLAPMAGVTDAPFRLLCAEQGAALTVTEMISAKGVLCAPPGNRALRDLLFTLPGSGPTALQLFGSEPGVMAEAALRLLDGSSAFCLIDLNMGCPAPKIVREGAGCALMRQPALAARVVEAVARVAPVPVTVKMRLGWDAESRNGVAFARAVQESGAAAVAVHGRTRDQFYAGQADWEAVAEIKAALRVPVFGNGDLATGEEFAERAAVCDGAMIGRGAMGNPWIFAEASRALRGEPTAPVCWEERSATAMRHLELMVEWKGERAAIPEMRKHIGWYIKGLPGAVKLRAAVNRMETMREMLGLWTDQKLGL